MSEAEYTDDMALIRFAGDYATAAQFLQKSYGSLTASTRRQRRRGEECLYYLNELKRMRESLPPDKRDILQPQIPIGYSKKLPRVGA